MSLGKWNISFSFNIKKKSRWVNIHEPAWICKLGNTLHPPAIPDTWISLTLVYRDLRLVLIFISPSLSWSHGNPFSFLRYNRYAAVEPVLTWIYRSNHHIIANVIWLNSSLAGSVDLKCIVQTCKRDRAEVLPCVHVLANPNILYWRFDLLLKRLFFRVLLEQQEQQDPQVIP